MTDQQPVETIEIDDIPDDLSELGEAQERPPYRTLLELWRVILEPATSGQLRDDPISPQWATKIVNLYPEVRYADVDQIHHGVFDLAGELSKILEEEIASDDESLKKPSVTEDAEENAAHYFNVLVNWQIYLQAQELSWRPGDTDAAIQLAILSEVHAMFFGETGLVAHLDSIGFQFTEADQAELGEKLAAARREALGVSGE